MPVIRRGHAGHSLMQPAPARVVRAAKTPVDLGPTWRLLFRPGLPERPFELWAMPAGELAEWRASFGVIGGSAP